MTEVNWNCLTNESNLNNSSRSSHTLNGINDRLFVFGGENEPRIPIDNDLHVFDLKTNEWSVIKSNEKSPSARLGHSSCSFGNKLYIFGGRQSVDMEESSLNDLYSFDTDTNEWHLLKSANSNNKPPAKRSFHSMCYLDNKLYIFGGCSVDHGRLNDLFEFDLNENKWTQLPSDDQIKPRGGTSLQSYQNNSEEKCLYLTGGFCGYELNDCWKYDIINKNWIQLQDLPRHLSVFASASIMNENSNNIRLIIHGGEVDPSTQGHLGAGEFSESTFIFNGTNWSLLNVNNNKPNSRGWHSGCYLATINEQNYFFIHGGNLENNKRTNELWKLKIF